MKNDQEKKIDANKIVEERKLKLQNMRLRGNSYPNDFKRSHLSLNLTEKYENFDNDSLKNENVLCQVAGRIILKRVMGKASFLTILDMSGTMQLYVTKDILGNAIYDYFKTWDIGDIIGAEGNLFKTNTNQLSIRVKSINLLTKSLRPLPEKFHGLNDQELKYRKRYLDLISSKQSRDVFFTRSKIINFLRNFFISIGYLEVETPMMHPIPGGATAKPFETHHNALNMKLFLRVAPELYLKKLVVGGFEKVFEINRSFRNEGLSTKHNPEFTMLEFYEAFKDYTYLMDLTEKLLRDTAKACIGRTRFQYQGNDIDLNIKYDRLTIKEAVVKYNPQFIEIDFDNLAELKKIFDQLEIEFDDSLSIGEILFKIFEETTESKIIKPTFIISHPIEVSPLSRSNDEDPNITDRFELFICGREIANGFSELNDPQEQSKRFIQQAKIKANGNEEAMYYDEEYIEALEFGLPPTAGQGIGIDRLVMLLTNSSSIRDVILFPQMRKK